MFKKYNSIENTYREEFLERIRTHGFWDFDYIVQEKAHGANISFWTTDGIHFFAAKRTAPILKEEKFNNYEMVLEEIKPQLAKIWKALLQKNKTLKQVTFFGEIIGGNYPHKDIPKDKQAIKVQKGIYYSPRNHFYAFDILINHERYLDVEDANFYFKKEGMFYAKTLFKGDITQCLNYSNAFESTLPKDLGMTPITNNLCEGVIIRPIKNLQFNNGSRVILKNKNEKWSENIKFHKVIKKEEIVSEKIIKLQEAILTYSTENRLNNVLSKVGEITKKDFGRILGLFNKDIVDDFKKDYANILKDLDKKEIKHITKSLGKITYEMVSKIC